MTKPPSFLRRPRGPVIETGIRDIISRLNAAADAEVSEILAGAVNLYLAALLRFRGNSSWKAEDIGQLLRIWEILLDTRKEPATDFVPAREARSELSGGFSRDAGADADDDEGGPR